MNENPFELSDEGKLRRETILEELTAELGRRQKTRRIRRHAIALSSLAFALAGGTYVGSLVISVPAQRTDSSSQVNSSAADTVPSPTPTALVVQRIATDPTIVTRWQMPEASAVVHLDDDGLLQTLDEIDRPSGIVRIQGRVWLTHAVADQHVDPDQS